MTEAAANMIVVSTPKRSRAAAAAKIIVEFQDWCILENGSSTAKCGSFDSKATQSLLIVVLLPLVGRSVG